jgi:hypothetical protein
MTFVRIAAIAMMLLVGVPIGRAWYRECLRNSGNVIVSQD